MYELFSMYFFLVNYRLNNNDEEQWRKIVYSQPYPSEYNYNQNPYESNSPINQTSQHTPQVNDDHRDHRLDSNYTPALAIRRHTPGSTDPILQQLSPSPSPSRTPKARVTFKKDPVYPVPVRSHSPVALDPDERPIRPMKTTAVYTKPSSPTRIIQPRKPVSPPKPVYSPPVSPDRYESDSFQAPPSRTRINTVLPRRPIRTDLIPKTPFGIPSRRNRSRQIVFEEEEEYDDYPPVEHVYSTPKRILAYQEVHGMTTRELENYLMSKARYIEYVQTPPIRTVIYRR
jgi:hypothetical protein